VAHSTRFTGALGVYRPATRGREAPADVPHNGHWRVATSVSIIFFYQGATDAGLRVGRGFFNAQPRQNANATSSNGKLGNGGRVAHQRPHSIMDNADNAAVGYLNNAPVSHLAFILPSVGCSVSVAGSDIGPKVLDIMVGR
jgi:hypothetical protein